MIIFGSKILTTLFYGFLLWGAYETSFITICVSIITSNNNTFPVVFFNATCESNVSERMLAGLFLVTETPPESASR